MASFSTSFLTLGSDRSFAFFIVFIVQWVVRIEDFVTSRLNKLRLRASFALDWVHAAVFSFDVRALEVAYVGQVLRAKLCAGWVATVSWPRSKLRPVTCAQVFARGDVVGKDSRLYRRLRGLAVGLTSEDELTPLSSLIRTGKSFVAGKRGISSQLYASHTRSLRATW